MVVWSEVKASGLIKANRFDGEYFQPSMIQLESMLSKFGSEKLSTRRPMLTYGTTPKGAEWVEEDVGVPFVRSQDFSGGIVEGFSQYCSKHHHTTNQKSAISGGDVLVAAIGATIGSVGLYPTSFGEANTNQNIARIRLDNWEDNVFLWSFLCSSFGNRQLHRLATGNAQPYLNSIQMNRILIPWTLRPLFDSEIVKKFEISVQQSHEFYLQAEQVLEAELGVNKLLFTKPMGYATKFSDLELSRRFDAEHFYPAFDNLKEKLPEHVRLVPLGPLLTFCQRGKQPIYSENGLQVLNSKHILENKITLEGNRFAKPNPVVSLQIQHGDVLINGTGRGTIGRTAPYLINRCHAIPDNHVTILRSSILDPAYLSFFMNSLAGKLQVEKYQRGSSGQLELYPFDIRKFQVWEAPKSIQLEIRRLYELATERADQAKTFLQQAKTRVEQLIEEAVKL
jgi:type I restriction enzyme M protein